MFNTARFQLGIQTDKKSENDKNQKKSPIKTLDTIKKIHYQKTLIFL